MDWLELLPHQPPMRLIEEVIEVVPGDRVVARRRVHADDFYLQGHFPGQPIVPAIILVELIAQAGGLAAGSAVDDATAALSLRVAAVGPLKFPAAAQPGAMLEVRARVAGRIGSLYKIEGEVTADGVAVAVGVLTLAG